MIKCEQCNKDYEAKRATSRFCSAGCRVQYNRGVSVTQPDKVSVTDVSVTQPEQAGMSNVYIDIDKASQGVAELQAKRTNPDRLNYGAPMNSDQLASAGKAANRVPIPGDSDYSGVCVKVDGVWQVRQGAA